MLKRSKLFLVRIIISFCVSGLVHIPAIAKVITDSDSAQRPIVKMKESLVNTGVLRMALTSHERGFKGSKKDLLEYEKVLHHALFNRAQGFCEADGDLGLAGIPETEELDKSWENEKRETAAWIPQYNESTQKYELLSETFLREKRWTFRKTKRTEGGLGGAYVSSSCWAGVISCLVTAGNPIGAAIVGALGVGILTCGAILEYNDRLTPEQARQHISEHKSVYERSSFFRSVFGKSVPHLVFSSLPCSNDPNKVEKFWNDFDEKENASGAPWVSRKPFS